MLGRAVKRRGGLVGLGVWVVAAALALPGIARADTTVTFDDLPVGTQVTDQYANAGGPGQGVTFEQIPGGPFFESGPYIASAAGQAHSGSQVADISCPGCNENLGNIPVATAAFGAAHAKISVYVGLLGSLASPCATNSTAATCAVVTLTAYDAGGNMVATSSPVTVTQGAGVDTLVSVSTPTATIVGFEVSTRDPTDANKHVAIDDLTFDTPVTTPPDFNLSAASSNVGLIAGQSASDTITIHRFGGSTGDVDFTLNGTLPSGVTAQISPNPASGDEATLMLTADATAAQTVGAFPSITITGTPGSAAVGLAARSVTVSFGVQTAFGVFIPSNVSHNVDLSKCAVQLPVGVTREASFAGQISLAVSGLPPGVTGTFSSQPVFANGSTSDFVTLDIVAPANGQPQPQSTATVTASSPGFPDQTTTFTVGGACPVQYDAQATSIQITQGVQSPFLPVQGPTVTTYADIPHGAELRAGGPTVVRAYADLAFGPSGGVANVPMVLAGYTHDESGGLVFLPGSPLLPTSSPARLQIGPGAPSVDDESSETAPYTFTLPPSWTHGTITLIAELQPWEAPPQSPAVAPCTTTACDENVSMILSHIPFYDAPAVTVVPIQMEVNGVPMPNPSSVFQWARLVTPLDVNIEPYQGTVDITDISNKFNTCVANHHGAAEYSTCSDNANSAVGSRVDDFVCNDQNLPELGWVVGVNTGVARGLENPFDWCWSELHAYADAITEWQRPLTSVAHEFFHLLGRPHASNCGGGGSNGQTAESWPPDQMGYTQSIGLDTTLGSGIDGGPYALPSPANSSKPWFDFMSYCANTNNTSDPLTLDAWGSTHNWNAVMEQFRYHAADIANRSAPATSAARPSLEVDAAVPHGAAAQITAVTPLIAASRALPVSGFELVGLDAAGQQVASAPMFAHTLHIDGEAPPIRLSGLIPAASVVAVEVVSGGTVLVSRHAGVRAPTVRLPGFRRSAVAPSRSAGALRAAALLASIDYSADGGRRYPACGSGRAAGASGYRRDSCRARTTRGSS